MNKLKLLIADCDDEFCQCLSEALEDQYQILTCGDGGQALDILRREHCDLMVLDPVLPGLDGVSLLRAAINEELYPKVMVVSVFVSPYVEQISLKLGVNYVIRKPAAPGYLAQLVADMTQPIHPIARSAQSYLFDLLLSLRLATKHNGFNYLREAIILAALDPGQPVTKVLYPAVAEKCSCTGRQVERSIRSALESAWEHRDEAVWQHYFPSTSRRPTNAAFISRMAEELHRAQQSGLVFIEGHGE